MGKCAIGGTFNCVATKLYKILFLLYVSHALEFNS